MGIVVLTMHNDDETLLEALDAGASPLVLKTPRADEVIAPYAVPPPPPTRSPPSASPTPCAAGRRSSRTSPPARRRS